MSIIKTGLKTDNYFNGAELNDLFYISNGFNRMICYDLVDDTNMGIRPPPSAVTDEGSNISGSLIVGGAYKAKVEYFNFNKATSSGMSPASAAITCQSNGGIRITIPADSGMDTQVTHIKAYLTADGANIYRYDGYKAYTGSEITYDFTAAESARTVVMGELNEAETANLDVHLVPPTCPFLMAHQDRMWFFGTYIYSTGTVTVSDDPTVVGSGAGFVQGMKRMFFQIDGDARLYLVGTVTDEDNIELTDLDGNTVSYAGTAGAGKTYYIFGEDSILYYGYIDIKGNSKPESVPVTNWVPVNKDDGFRGTLLGKAKTTPLVGKELGLYVLAGDNPANYRTILLDASVEPISHRSGANDDNGNFIFAAKDGVYVSDGRSPSFDLSKDIKNVFTGEGDPPWSVNQSRLRYSHGVFDSHTNRYLLWVALSTSSKEDRCLVYDFNKVEGNPIGWSWWNIEASCSAIIRDDNDKTWVQWGREDFGFVMKLDSDATNDGAGSSDSETRRGTATGGTVDYLDDSGATFNTTGDGLKAVPIKILSGTAAGDERVISSNTSTRITPTVAFTAAPDTTSVYAIGYIDAYRKTGWLDFGSLADKFIRNVKMVFKVASTTYSAYLKHYTDFSTTQLGDTKYLNMAEPKGYHDTGIAANRAKHHMVEFGLCDVDRVIEVKELELTGGTFGVPEKKKEATS